MTQRSLAKPGLVQAKVSRNFSQVWNPTTIPMAGEELCGANKSALKRDTENDRRWLKSFPVMLDWRRRNSTFVPNIFSRVPSSRVRFLWRIFFLNPINKNQWVLFKWFSPSARVEPCTQANALQHPNTRRDSGNRHQNVFSFIGAQILVLRGHRSFWGRGLFTSSNIKCWK